MSKIGDVGGLYGVGFGKLMKERFVECGDERRFVVKEIKWGLIMKYFEKFWVGGDKDI